MTTMNIVFKRTGTYNNRFLIREQYLCGCVINRKIWTGCCTSKRKIKFHISITDGGSVSYLLFVGDCGCVACNLRGYGSEREVHIRGSFPVMYSNRVECYVNVSFRHILAYIYIYCLMMAKLLFVTNRRFDDVACTSSQ